MLKKLYKRLLSTMSFLYAFHHSPAYKEWRSGAMSLNEAIQAFTYAELIEHNQAMENMRRREWALNQRLNVMTRKCERVEQDIAAAEEEIKRLEGEREELS